MSLFLINCFCSEKHNYKASATFYHYSICTGSAGTLDPATARGETGGLCARAGRKHLSPGANLEAVGPVEKGNICFEIQFGLWAKPTLEYLEPVRWGLFGGSG